MATSRSDTWLGYAAVCCVVVCFSLGSTLVKRANTPGVVVSFWRLVGTTVTWNLLLASRGQRMNLTTMKQALVPGILFGLNLTTFYVAATHNSVANAEMIGAIVPFILVPVGAVVFKEWLNPRAFVFAVVALTGVGLVLFVAPTRGDASTLGNVLGLVALLLWSGYVVTARAFRKDMDVVRFMAATSPIALVTMSPLALVKGHIGEVNANGWFYITVLIVVTGMTAHGLMVFAQKTVPIGTISVATVAQPALAALWSYLLVGETLHGLQVVGMALTMFGILAFVVVNQRTAPA